MDGVEAAAHVEVDDRVELGRACLDAGLADRPRPTGDVHQDVDAAMGIEHLGVPPPRRRPHRSGRRRSPGAPPTASATGAIAAVSRPSSANRHPSADEGARHGGAHAFGRAGDDRNAALQSKLHRRRHHPCSTGQGPARGRRRRQGGFSGQPHDRTGCLRRNCKSAWRRRSMTRAWA